MEILPIILALSSSLTSGFTSILLKYSTKNVKPLLVNSLKSFSGTLGLTVVILFSGKTFTIDFNSLMIILYISITGPVLGWLLYIMALEKSGVSLIHPIVNSYPIFAMLAGLLLGYQVSTLDIIGGVIAVLGFKLLFSNGGKVSLKAVLLAFGTAVFWGINTTLFKFLLETGDPMVLAFWRSLTATIVLLPVALLKIGLPSDFKGIISSLLAGQLSDVLIIVLWLTALQLGELAPIAVLSSLGPLFSGALSKIVFGEKVSSKRYLGIVIVILGVSLVVV